MGSSLSSEAAWARRWFLGIGTSFFVGGACLDPKEDHIPGQAGFAVLVFLSVHPSFSRIARLMVAIDTRTPRALSHNSQWRSKVASSFSSSCFHSARLSSALERMRRLRPVERLGSRSSPWRRRFTQRLMVEREIPNGRETSSRGEPRSTASSTRNLRSFEYAFMAHVLAGTTQFTNRSNPQHMMVLEVALESVMNFSSGTVASGHGYSKTIPKRCFR